MRVVVVGGGVSGLAGAALLAREGHEVTLVEARDEVGGRASTWGADGFRFDIGPSWYLMPEVFEHFLRLMGTSATEQLDLVPLDPAYRVFFERHDPLDVRSDLADSVALFERVEPGSGARLRAYLESGSDAYHMALQHFLYTSYASLRPLLTPAVLRRAPELAGLLTRSLESKVRATVQDTRLRQVLGYPAVFLGASPRLTPSMYHLMSHLDLADGVLYPQGGFGAVVDAVRRVAEQAGVRIRTGCAATAITTGPVVGGLPAGLERQPTVAGLWRRRKAQVTGVTVVGSGAAGAGGRAGEEHLPADVVIAATDLEETERRLLPAALRSYSDRWWRRQVPGPSTVMVYLGVRGRLPELPHHSLFLAEDWDTTFDLIFDRRPGAPVGAMPDPTSVYVSRTSSTDPGVAPEGHENLVILVPVPADVRLGHGGLGGAGDPWVERVADAAIAQIGGWAGVPDLADRIVVRRTVGPADWAQDLRAWRGTALGPAHTLGQSAMFRAGNVSRRVAGLLYAGGSVIPGIGVPMCLISAELLVKRFRGDTSAGPLAEPGDIADRTADVAADREADVAPVPAADRVADRRAGGTQVPRRTEPADGPTVAQQADRA
ncbi:phytoene desaturase family protein [Actinotalea sp. M2MS4P-6]|uniref:phytoene desaturase family protein n=1 Tax=Actinotalea sp. M2MS4P-6 TaxID=2983762 RepID=UPI0021E4E631|nr:phytoene desaturase family protein [Actinotalea sp. M2MS4P-6]MCV2393027.1 phytoene desaturase family protein [Actinotalea sp. M2MS4P-6]